MRNSQKFRICHLTSVHSFRDTRIFLKECCSLASYDNYEVYLVAPDVPEMSRTEYNVKLVQGVKNLHKNRLQRVSRSVYQTYRAARSLNADIYHFHDPELLPIGLLLKSEGKKVIYDVHEDLPRQTLSKFYIAPYLRPLMAAIIERIENFASKKFDALVTATPHIRERFQLNGCHTIDINNYPILEELHYSTHSWSEKQNIVSYIGSISEPRGIIQMVQAISHTNGKLLLGGHFSSSKQREQTTALSGWSQVQELGFLDREGVSYALAQSMAGLVTLQPVPNYLNSLPVKMFEYMSAGLPVIASNFPLWERIIEGNQCGICVNPVDDLEIAQAIQWIFEHPQEAKQMGKNGQNLVKREYNWNNEAKKLFALYESILA